MKDQASVLREMARLRQLHQPQWKEGKAKLVFIGSGKGGVGKSFVALSLAQVLGQKSQKVLLVDANLANPSLHVMTNVVVDGKETVNALLQRGRRGHVPVVMELDEKISLFPNEGSTEQLFAGGTDNARFLLQQLQPFARVFDFIILDSQTGLNSWNLTLLQQAHRVFLITIPEPTAIIDTYLYIKAASFYANPQSMHIVVNQVYHPKGGEETHEKLNMALDHFLHFRVPLACSIAFDLQVRSCLYKQMFPFLGRLGEHLQQAFADMASHLLEKKLHKDAVKKQKQGVAL